MESKDVYRRAECNIKGDMKYKLTVSNLSDASPQLSTSESHGRIKEGEGGFKRE